MRARILAIIRREYLERVRTKAFWISTALVPLFMVGMMLVPMWLTQRGGGEFTVALLDPSGKLAQPVQRELSGLLENRDDPLKVTLEQVEISPDLETTREMVKGEILDKAYDGMLILPPDLSGENRPQYVAPNVAAFRLLELLERSVNEVVVSRRLENAGLEPDAVRELTRRVGLSTLKLSREGEETEDEGQAFLLSFVLMFVIYISVLMYGLYVMRGVLEEKQSSIVEVILGTVRPFELLLGKVLGIGAVGLTQFVLWTVVGLLLAAPGATQAMGFADVQLPELPVTLMVFFVIFFVLGFLLYGTLYAAIGAAFDNEQDAQHFQTFVTLFMVVAYLLVFLMLHQPESALATVLSLIPFFAPMLMFLRMTLITVPALEIAACVVLMVAAIFGVLWVAAKIYRVGLLASGSKPSLKDIVRWLREA